MNVTITEDAIRLGKRAWRNGELLESPLSTFQKVFYEKAIQSWPSARPLQLAVCVRLDSAIETDVFEQAARALARRHPILAARLDYADEVLIQRLTDEPPSFEVIDLGSDELEINFTLSAEADRLFDLFCENPFKIVLGRSHGASFVLLIGHHIFFDEFSMQELLSEYIRLVLPPESATEPVARDSGGNSYFAWCRQQDEMFRSGALARKMGFWISYLAGCEPLIRLPGRVADPEFQTLAEIPFGLDPDAMRASLERARRLHVTHFAVAASAIFNALHRVTGQDNMLLSVVSDARRHPFDRTIGQFAETFVMRKDGCDGMVTDDNIRLIFGHLMKAQKNYVSPAYYADEVDWLRERRDRKCMIAEVIANYAPSRPALGGAPGHECAVSHVVLANRSKPPRSVFYGTVLSFSFRPERGALQGSLVYESALVTADGARDIAAAVCDGIKGFE